MLILRRGTFGALALLAWVAPAAAAPATQAEADRLKALFERYTGAPAPGTPSAVSVTPEGEGYKASLDVGRLLAPLASLGLSATAGPIVAVLTPQADGPWRVQVDGLPDFGVAHDGQASSMSFQGYTLDGLFDPAMRSFRSATTGSAGVVSHATGPKGSSNAKVTGTAVGTYAASPGASGTIDMRGSQSQRQLGYAIDIVVPGDDGAPATSVKASATGEALTASSAIDGIRSVAWDELWTFLVAHPSRRALTEAQDELKTRLKAVLPLATAANGDLAVSKLSVQTDHGTVGLDEASYHYEFNRAASKDRAATTIKVSGLVLPSGLLPAWAAPLVPTGLDFAQNGAAPDLTDAARNAIDALDLAAPKPIADDVLARIGEELAAAGTTMHLGPITLTLPAMLLKLDGDLTLTRPLPSGMATVTATGLDKTIDRLRQGAPDSAEAGQAVAFLQAAKMLGKAQGEDSYLWRIEAAPGQVPTVNGTPLGGAPAARPKRSRKPAPVESP